MSNLFVDKISGKSGTSSGAPITLSGDTATLSSGVTIPAAGVTGTLGSGVTFPAGTITGYTRTITTPTAQQGGDTSNTTMTGSSVSYTPAPGASFVVYEYSAYLMAGNVYTLQLIHFKKNGSLMGGTNWQMNLRTDASFIEFSPGQVLIKHVMPAWSGAQTLEVVYQQWETGAGYTGRWHSSTYSGNETGTDVWVDTYRTTYSVM